MTTVHGRGAALVRFLIGIVVAALVVWAIAAWFFVWPSAPGNQGMAHPPTETTTTGMRSQPTESAALAQHRQQQTDPEQRHPETKDRSNMLGLHRISPPDDQHPHWRGEAQAPATGKPSPAIDVAWEWHPAADPSQAGTLHLSLTTRTGDAAMYLQLQAINNVEIADQQTHSQQAVAGQPWHSSHQLRPTAERAQIGLTYGIKPLARSISIPLGWDGRAAPLQFDDAIQTDHEFLLPAAPVPPR